MWRNTKNKPNNKANNNSNNKKSKGYIIIPYMQGLRESIKNICGKYGIQTFFKSNRTSLGHQRIDKIQEKSGIIYWSKCQKLHYNDECIGESSRTFDERLKQHLKAPSLINDHQTTTGHRKN